VFIRRRIRDGKWLILAAGAVAFAFVFCGSGLSCAAVSAETNSAASADKPSHDPMTPDPTPFNGSPEIKTRLDAPGKPTIAGERLHDWLLRRFYIAHGYQTVWDGHPEEATRLLWDAVRVMVRLLRQADELSAGAAPAWRSHRRLAKKRALAIKYSRSPAERIKLYRELIAATRTTLGHLQTAAAQMPTSASLAAEAWQAQVRHYQPLIERIMAQCERRVLRGETVPAQEKLVSLFETHADIILKGSREPCYGHKLNLTSGRSGLILDLVIETGNPADSERFVPMLDRHITFYGSAPRQAAADGGYATRDNLDQAKARGVADVAFHKKRGLTIEDMVKSHWVYRKLRNFRAGIEAGISCLKRAYGLARSTWRGLAHFKAYVWSSVVAYNLALLARLRPA